MILSKEFYANCISREVRGNVINMIDKNIVRYDTKYFAYLMSNDLKDITDKGIFEDTSSTIYNALKNTHSNNPSKTGIAKAAFEIALKQLV